MNISVILRRYGKFGIFILVCIVFTAFLYTLVSHLSTIRRIELVGSNLKIELNEQKFPSNLLFFPEDKIKRELLREYPLLSDVDFDRIFPFTLKLTIYSRVPQAKLVSGKRAFYIDEEGVIIGNAIDNSQLPTIIIPDESIRIASRKTDELTTQSLRVVRLFSPIIAVESITATQSSNIQVKTNVTSIYITQKSDVIKIVDTLQTLLTGFRIKGTMPRIIDLRFTKPVVTY